MLLLLKIHLNQENDCSTDAAKGDWFINSTGTSSSQTAVTLCVTKREWECVCVVGGSRRSAVRVNVSFPCMLIPPYGEDIPAGCVHVWEILSAFPPSVRRRPPHRIRIPRKFLCHVVLRGGWALLLQNSHPGSHTHLSIRGVSATQTEQQQQKKQGIPFWLWWLYLHSGDSDTRMTNVARLHLAPWQRAVQTFMMQHFEYFLFMTKFLLMSEGYKRKHQSSLAAMIDFFTLTCINRNYLQASYINHASNALSPLAHSSLGRTDYAGCVYIFISVPLLMWIMC